jgi:hypothetical protein
MRWIDATTDSVTYVRESPTENVLVHLVRRPCESRAFDAAEVGMADRPGADGCTVEFGQGDLVEMHLDVGDGADTIVMPGTPGAYVVSCARR